MRASIKLYFKDTRNRIFTKIPQVETGRNTGSLKNVFVDVSINETTLVNNGITQGTLPGKNRRGKGTNNFKLCLRTCGFLLGLRQSRETSDGEDLIRIVGPVLQAYY